MFRQLQEVSEDSNHRTTTKQKENPMVHTSDFETVNKKRVRIDKGRMAASILWTETRAFMKMAQHLVMMV